MSYNFVPERFLPKAIKGNYYYYDDAVFEHRKAYYTGELRIVPADVDKDQYVTMTVAEVDYTGTEANPEYILGVRTVRNVILDADLDFSGGTSAAAQFYYRLLIVVARPNMNLTDNDTLCQYYGMEQTNTGSIVYDTNKYMVYPGDVELCSGDNLKILFVVRTPSTNTPVVRFNLNVSYDIKF